ncbi:MAG: hypothetical protein ACOX6H_04015 [Christensenellales bacterium]
MDKMTLKFEGLAFYVSAIVAEYAKRCGYRMSEDERGEIEVSLSSTFMYRFFTEGEDKEFKISTSKVPGFDETFFTRKVEMYENLAKYLPENVLFITKPDVGFDVYVYSPEHKIKTKLVEIRHDGTSFTYSTINAKKRYGNAGVGYIVDTIMTRLQNRIENHMN